MTRESFRSWLREKYIFLDGATGSNLMKAGMPAGVCPELWIDAHEDVLFELQKKYVEAGSDILYAPTFTANRVKLAEYGLNEPDKQSELIDRLVRITRCAADSCEARKIYVAGDISMTGRQLRPMGDMELEDLIDVYKAQIAALVRAEVDLLVIETMMSLAETRAALIAAKELCDLPVLVTMTFEQDGRTLYGTDAETAAVVAESLGADAFGVNCSTGPAHMRELIRSIASVTTIPIIAKPNAGMPFVDEQGRTSYDMHADEFAAQTELLAEAGATILGGCCGTDPDYIAALYEKFHGREPARVPRRPEGIHYLTSERRTVAFGLDGNFMIVGERINPTGKKALQAQLREGSMDMVLQFAEEQERNGAQVLDVNMGMSGIDEREMMLRAIEEISGVTNLPLSLDSSHTDVLEAALRRYPGRALVNSVSLETEKIETLLPIVAKYGAMFILLPLSDRGLPENFEEKRGFIEEIWRRAQNIGMRREDIVVDGLVTTVGANKNAALEVLETIRYCREQGFATICGLSNISFGMPERSFINTAFLTMAIREGLTMAIANPSQELLISCALAADLLLNRESADLRYIEYVKRGDAQEKVAQGKSVPENAARNVREDLYHGVLKGNRNGTAALTQAALDAGETPDGLLNEVLLPAINEVGNLFEKGKYFLPQLIASAEAMKNAIAVLEPLLRKDVENEDMPTVVIATVEGDIHDIGKNLVALMLKNYGFRVIDLGKDVPAERIIQTARENNAQIIALSALMTTTMQRMREVVDRVRDEKLSAKVMIGGAVITQDYADEIGADGYSKDAADAVKLAKHLNESY